MSDFGSIWNKVGGWALIKQYAKAGVLFYALAQLCLTGFSRKSLELLRLDVQLKIQNKLRRMYLPILKKFDAERCEETEFQSDAVYRKVWICWLQGIENAPELVQKCYASIQEHITDREIVLITSENRKQYVAFPDYIEQKYESGIITHTHFSDLLRIALLAQYGGTWIDATVFCSGGTIPKYMLDSDFFVFQNLKPGADGHVLNISSWFMTARTRNKIVTAVRDLLYAYWEKNNNLIDYFLLHHFFAIVADYYAEDWKNIIPFSNAVPHILLLRLFEPYNEECYNETKRMCPFHKLAYKRSSEEFCKKGTYYDVIFNSIEIQIPYEHE